MSKKQYKQSKLPSRFLPPKKNKIDLTFYLDSNGTARFENSSIDTEKFLFQIKWPDINQLLNVTCSLDIYSTLFDQTKIPRKKGLDPTWSSILKSHLQKNIRRKETSLALSTCKMLIEGGDLIILLRRLPIIVIEDTYLFRDYPTLIWLMIFFTEFTNKTISTQWINWILSCVYNLCQSTPWVDTRGKQSDFNWKNADIMINVNNRSLIYALQLRRIYGGMIGDQKMLNWFSLVWLKRIFSNKENELKRLDRSWPNQQLLTFSNHHIKFDDFNLAAIDFHPCPWIIHKLNSKYSEFSTESLRSTIWNCSSGINYRHTKIESIIMPDHQLIWNTIYDDWERLTQRILRSYLH